MPDKAKTLKSWVRKVSWVFAGLVFLFLLTALILRIFITTKSGASFIESQINKRNLGKASIEALRISESVIGRSAVFSLSGALNTEKSGVIRALLDVLRTDTVGDKLFLDFTRDDNGEMQGKFSLNGAPSGALTLLMGVPTDTAITGAGQVTGDMKSGQGDVVISFDDKDKLIAEGNS